MYLQCMYMCMRVYIVFMSIYVRVFLCIETRKNIAEVPCTKSVRKADPPQKLCDLFLNHCLCMCLCIGVCCMHIRNVYACI